MDALDEVLTLVNVADRLKIRVSTARQMVASGALRGLKVCNQWRVMESDLTAYLAHQRARQERQRPHLFVPPKKKRFS